MIEFEIEKVALEGEKKNNMLLKLPDLTEEEKNIVNPIVAPTSGLRIQIFDSKIVDGIKKYVLTNRKFFLFLRVFKAISQLFKEMKNGRNLNVLITTDDRPSRTILLNYCSQIFAHDGYEIYYQKDDNGESRTSSPYAAASVALFKDIKLIIMLTASHNDLSWNGIKFYIDYPIPISGDIFKAVFKKALEVKEIRLKSDFKPIKIDAEEKNNEYVVKLLSRVLDIKAINGKNIVIWPYLGKAREILNLFKDLGAKITVIEETINPPNPEKVIIKEKLQNVMEQANSDIAIILDADRDRIALHVKEKGEYFTYIPNEIYSALHNILAIQYNKRIINVRTIPSDLRGDHTSFINILTGVGYKHLGVLLYFLFGIEVDKSKVDSAILYIEDKDKNLVKIDNPAPVKNRIIEEMKRQGLSKGEFLVVEWEESGGHTLTILNVSKNNKTGEFEFSSEFPLIADKYPVPALVLITELLCRGYNISQSIDWSIKGINQTISASDKEKVKIMKSFEVHDGKTINIAGKDYKIKALSDNSGMVDIFQLKSKDSVLYFRPSGTGPEVKFYVIGKRETHLEEINKVMKYVNDNYK